MAVTSAGTPYVETSDLVANYPGVSLALANHIDANTGKILQVVRATDSTQRSTTSTSFVDASISVTITPQKATSAVLLIWSLGALSSDNYAFLAITDSSDVSISGAERGGIGAFTVSNLAATQVVIGYATPATTSATTYKGRFKTTTGTAIIENNQSTGQLYAIEVSA